MEKISNEMQETTNKRGGKTRDEFLADFPMMRAWVEKMEEFHGALQHCGSVPLDSGRAVLVAHFESAWHCNFFNPENGEGKDSITFNLSREGMCAMVGLYDVLSTKEQRAADWENLILSMRKSDAERDNANDD